MIKFGTDGWRAVIGDQFTYENVRRVAKAHAQVLKERNLRRVIVGYDWRFSSELFARQVCGVFKAEGLEVFLSDSACTTPMVSFAVKYLGFEAGVMITASHNPPHYNGYKIKESFGGSATPAFVKEVESRIPLDSPYVEDITVELKDIKNPYIEEVRNWIDTEILKEESLLLVHDAMHGTSSGLFNAVLNNTRVSVLGIRSHRDPLFGNHAPEPVDRYLNPLKEKVRAVSAHIGIANDGDGDRIALVDERGNFINTQLIYALLLLHLVKHRGFRRGCVVKTVSTTYLADRICREEGIRIKEVPVGFKNINEIILKEEVIFGGEESGGYGIPIYLPERDGLLSGLLLLELIALKEKRLSEIVNELQETYGKSFYRRIDLPADLRIKDKLKRIIQDPPESLAERSVEKVSTMDGLKLTFDDESWVLFRPSGTEPLIRVYAEAPSKEELVKLLESATALLRV